MRALKPVPLSSSSAITSVRLSGPNSFITTSVAPLVSITCVPPFADA